MAEQKKEQKKVKVMVRQDTSVFINGKETKVKKGTQSVDPEIARILIEAGYAEELK